MDTGLFIRFFGVFIVVLALILFIRGGDINKLEVWDWAFAFLSGPFFPVSLPVILVYLGVIYAHRKA